MLLSKNFVPTDFLIWPLFLRTKQLFFSLLLFLWFCFINQFGLHKQFSNPLSSNLPMSKFVNVTSCRRLIRAMKNTQQPKPEGNIFHVLPAIGTQPAGLAHCIKIQPFFILFLKSQVREFPKWIHLGRVTLLQFMHLFVLAVFFHFTCNEFAFLGVFVFELSSILHCAMVTFYLPQA